AKHQIQFVGAGGNARNFVDADVFKGFDGAIGGTGKTTAAATGAGGLGAAEANLRQGIPGAAFAALSLPFGVIGAAVIADKGTGFFLAHVFSLNFNSRDRV